MKAIILGNGPSLTKFYKGQIAELTFGVNRIYNLPKVHLDYFVALDKTVWSEASMEIKKLDCKQYFVWERYYEYAYNATSLKTLYPLKFLNKGEGFKSFKEGVHHYNCSIAPCLQIAKELRATEISLYGVDCGCYIEQKSHFYGDRRCKIRQWKRQEENLGKLFSILNIPITVFSDLFQGKNCNIVKD